MEGSDAPAQSERALRLVASFCLTIGSGRYTPPARTSRNPASVTAREIEVGKNPRTPRCIAAEAVASSLRFDNSGHFFPTAQIAGRGHFDDFESGELSLKYIGDASMRQNLIAMITIIGEDCDPLIVPLGLAISTFREKPRPLTSLEQKSPHAIIR